VGTEQNRSRRRRYASRQRGEPAWHKAERTKCQLCNGRGKYHAAYPWRLIDPCPKCGGTGHVAY